MLMTRTDDNNNRPVPSSSSPPTYLPTYLPLIIASNHFGRCIGMVQPGLWRRCWSTQGLHWC